MFLVREGILRFIGISACFLRKTTMSDFCGPATSSNDENSIGVKRLLSVEGLDGKFNDIIYHPPKSDTSSSGKVIFFGGDVQDYPENMLTHRDNKHHVQWNLEVTAKILHKKFPSMKIFIIKPSRMHLRTFSCYENFVPGNDCGVPCHEASLNALSHLQRLLKNSDLNSETCSEDCMFIIGFSKGCVVLNQLLFSFTAVKSNESELWSFVQKIKAMYWLDGGHSGGSNTWIINKPVLRHFSNLGIDAHIHVTPYQVRCESRPWIGKEEQGFRKTLKHLGVNVHHQLHFDEEPRSLENHFRVLEIFVV